MKKSSNTPKKQTPDAQPQQSAPAPEPATNATIASPALTEPMIGEMGLKRIFLFSILGMLLIAWIGGFNVGFHCDEMDMNAYGKANYAFYSSGGKDMSFMGCKKEDMMVDTVLKYYGSAFELIAVGVNKVTGMDKTGVHEYDSRHFINQIFGILAILFAGLIAKRISGWRAAIFTSWLLFLTPSFFGHILFNTKDIPFCAGYTAAIYYMILFLEELPAPTWRSTIGLTVSFAFATNTRIGGILLLGYLFIMSAVYVVTTPGLLPSAQKKAKDLVLKYVTVIFGGFVLIVITWPYLMLSPVSNLITTMGIAKKFPVKVNVNFEGVRIDSLNLPINYIPKFMAITIPIFILLSLFAGAVFFVRRIREYDWRIGLLLAIATFFPVVFAVLSKASLYSGWRHFLFIYPGLCLIAGIGLAQISIQIRKPALQLAFLLLCVVGMFRPIMWCIKNHPYEYTYFNELAGGFEKAFYAYDNDYWEITMKNAVEKMMQNEPIAQSKDTVIIATNAEAFVKYYIKRHYPGTKFKTAQSGFTLRNSNNWQYAVFNSLFVKPEYLENYFPPPYKYSENIDGIPVTIIMKDTARLDWKAAIALREGKHQLCDSLYKEYIRTTKDDNVGIYAYMSVAKGSLNQNDDAISLANKALEYHLSPLMDYNAYCGLGIAYANKRKWQESIGYLNKGIALMPKEAAAKDIMRQVLAAKQAMGE